ncbi:hypothetical protein SPLC1_S511080 [Arthrospira platensis C1]|uniref:DUF4382 domain-containing protein n=2 Tax=Sirenicapillariaceae TaxID=2934961 RepID=A0A9P1KG82_9CYAN|nr:hypothetical protein SPLC1_S511080 [Arthrospira platensis C1]RAQ38862.1 hypothetical protein B9S53_25010 [Arthrospira sp. O9.13F]UWU48298.1 hypothetical protein APLC1_3090 [Arthrospira platensis C1]CDM95676.1 conserved protein of unknown function [Limnospira indica PCC 8005]
MVTWAKLFPLRGIANIGRNQDNPNMLSMDNLNQISMKQLLWLTGLILLAPMALVGCAPETETATETANEIVTNGQEGGTLTLIADAEDRMREGFVSKDGWELNFNHAHATFNNIRAYQAQSPFDPDTDSQPDYITLVELLNSPTTVDLVGGTEDTPTVTTAIAPPGHYNALSWEMVTATEGEFAGSTLVLDGTAERDGRTINFTIALNKPVAHFCGEYVGDERKGFLEANGVAKLETTFHFDHFFGRSDRPIDQSPNDEAIGFQPFANIAEGDTLNVTSQELQQLLTEEEYNTLVFSVTELGHVGEGHCRIELL